MSRILLIDDDKKLCEMVAEFLQGEGYHCAMAHEGPAALEMALAESFDALVLDVMLPGMNGFDLLRQLREHSQVPVLMLTARGEETDSIIGLEIGADDYLAKPCNPRVLSARLRAVLRRSHSHDAAPQRLEMGDLSLLPQARQAFKHDKPLELTSAEFNILELLVREAGNVVSKENLSLHGLGRKLLPYDRSIDMHISSLRKKLGKHDDDTPRIHTLRGAGYLYAKQ
uniref:DNA-binding response regulator in two-component regulatory system with CpxA. Transcriptional regulatory protein CpxR n=1 Tax=Magnetococcus massalia (strain MO-1) TaxID=451514 RepID=A0A1S7LCB4_MAGMO|nr:DNA-binding response regulator in two-component regulatory system with CpxA. Transcriptional regulatory protein CpxR [Candidatus Magnetococcus massalia]